MLFRSALIPLRLFGGTWQRAEGWTQSQAQPEIPLLKEKSHLPIIVDPSHATGIRDLVLPMALAATAAGADGLMVEVHNDPPHALCDGPQSLTPEQFSDLAKKVMAIRPVAFTGKE